MGDGEGISHETERIVAEMVFFPEVYKMTKVLEDGIENGENIRFPLSFYFVNLMIF